MSNKECSDLARTYGQVAVGLYARDGGVMPGVHAIGEYGMSAVPPDGDLNDSLPGLVATLVWAARADFVILVAEGWRQIAEVGDPWPEHGSLEAMAETDPSIQTTIAVSVWEVRNPAKGYSIALTPTLADDGSPAWEVTGVAGTPKGALMEKVRQRLSNPIPLAPPPPEHLHIVAELIVDENGALEVFVDSAEPINN